MDSENEKLRTLLQKFQENGNLRDFGDDNSLALRSELKPHLEKLVKWVIGGYGGKVQNQLQIADYILISDEKDIFIHTLEEYTQMLLKPEFVGREEYGLS